MRGGEGEEGVVLYYGAVSKLSCYSFVRSAACGTTRAQTKQSLPPHSLKFNCDCYLVWGGCVEHSFSDPNVGISGY